MNIEEQRERFEEDAEPYGFNIKRCNQNFPTVEPWSEYKDNDTGHRWGGFLAGAESKQAELDKANARIAQLKQFIAENVYPDEKYDEIITKSPDTWLSENNKAVEVRVLEDFITGKIVKYDNDVKTRVLQDIKEMIEAKKSK